jgi:hypothetical protein
LFSDYIFSLWILDILTEEAKQISTYWIWLEAQNYAHLETLSITLWILATLGLPVALSLCSIYVVIITVDIQMECPWPKASKFTSTVLNLSWKIWNFFQSKEEIQYNVLSFFHFVCKHICLWSWNREGWFSNSCPGTINESYFKKNWKPLECIRSFNLLHRCINLCYCVTKCLQKHINTFLSLETLWSSFMYLFSKHFLHYLSNKIQILSMEWDITSDIASVFCM